MIAPLLLPPDWPLPLDDAPRAPAEGDGAGDGVGVSDDGTAAAHAASIALCVKSGVVALSPKGTACAEHVDAAASESMQREVAPHHTHPACWMHEPQDEEMEQAWQRP